MGVTSKMCAPRGPRAAHTGVKANGQFLILIFIVLVKNGLGSSLSASAPKEEFKNMRGMGTGRVDIPICFFL